MRKCALIVLFAMPLFADQPATATCCAGKTACRDRNTTCCCDCCGRQTACVETCCQLVCEMKKEKRTCWCVECREFCPLMPSCPCHHGCCECPLPHCGHPKCVKKLVKKEYQVDVPVYKCVVLHLCPACLRQVPASAATAPRTLRLPPSFQQRHRRRFRRRQRRRHPPQDRRSEPHVLVRCGVEPAVLLVARSPIPGQREPLPRKPRQRGRLAFCRREDRAVVSLLLRAGRQTGRPPCFRRFHPSSTSLTRSVPVYHWTVAPGVRIIDVGCAADAVATRKRIPDANHYPT